jgi:ubiquinone/menaquinone biosynthesis C-methylase UbiE
MLARLGLGGARRVLVLGDSLRGVFGTMVPQERIRVVQNGIDLASWPIDEATIASRTSSSPHVLYLANLFEAKGQRTMILALPEILAQHPDAHVTFAGRWIHNDFRDEMLALVERLGVAHAVTFTGPVDEETKRDLLRDATMLVFTPVEPEGLPWVVLEGMAQALPVVGTTQGVMSEVIVDGETGVFVRPGESSELAAAVVDLIDDPRRAERLGRAGRERIESVYSEEVAHARLVSVAMEAIGRNDEAPARSEEHMSTHSELGAVEEFWGIEACGTNFVEVNKYTREFFEHYREFRYRTEWHIPEVVPFSETRGKRVLEIGCGNGADGTLFASNGAEYVGVDLTLEAVNATAAHFKSVGLYGHFQQENAERLSFDNASFDFVYSHGVLHHTAVPQRAFDEVYRVLKPGGRAVIMLYHRNSFNYHVRIMMYMRARVLLRILSRAGRWKRDRTNLASEIAGHRTNQGARVWDLHYNNFLRGGWRYLTPSQFVHHCTDGPECPYAYVYSRSEAARVFSKFKSVSTRVVHFPLTKYGFDSKFFRRIETFLARLMGWYLFITLIK